MATAPTQLEFVQEVDAASIGDQVPNAGAGNLILFPGGAGAWYSKDPSGNVKALAGLTSVTGDGTSITVTNPTTAPVVALAAALQAKLANGLTGWIDVTQQSANPVAPGASGATNSANLQTILNNAAAGSVIYFPPGTYQFSAGVTASKDFYFLGVRGQTYMSLVANLGGNFITLDNTGFYTAFEGLHFNTFATQTAGYVIEAQNDVNVLVQDCFFVGSSTYPLAGCIDFTGTNSGNGAVLRNVYCAGFTGTGVNVASPLDTMYVQDLEVVNNNGGSASVGIQFTNGGAALIIDSQVIQCGVNIQLAPTAGNTVSAVFAVNSFFDQGRANSMVITGAGTVLRCHFEACWFTLASTAPTGSAAVLINTSGASVHAGLLFVGCHVLNTPAAAGATVYGFLVSACADLTISSSQVAGWTVGASVTPAGNGTTVLSVTDSTFGASGGVGASVTGINLAAGTYLGILVQGNNLLGCTTPLADASTVAADGRSITGNVGLANPPVPNPAAQVLAATTTYVTPALLVPANALRVGATFRFKLLISTTAAATTYTVLGKAGTAGTTADGTTVSLATTGTTTSVGAAEVEVTMTVRSTGAAGVIVASAKFAATGTGFSGTVLSGAAVLATATVNTTVANYVGVAVTASAASTGTVQAAIAEVVAQ